MSDAVDWTPLLADIGTLAGPMSDTTDWTEITAAPSPATADLADWTWANPASGGGGGGLPVSGFSAWWDATTISAADNTPLAAWPDSSGGGQTLTQATGAKQPTYYSSTPGKTINGHAAVWFNGGQLLSVSISTTAQPFTVLCVCSDTYAGAPGTNQMVWDSWPGSGGPVWLLVISTATGSLEFEAANALLGPAMSAGAHMVLCGGNGASSYVVKDGTTTNGDAGTNGLGTSFNLGCHAQDVTNSPWTGAVGEVVVWPRLLAAGEVTSLHGYCQTKWATP